jgi:lysozyme
MIQGIDIWSGYGQICWPLVASSGVEFAYIKCTEGNKGKDSAYEKYAQEARANGLVIGAYHFAYPLPTDPAHSGRSPREQAEAALQGCRALGADPGELSPAVDAEWPPPQEWARWGCSAASISEWLHEYCEAAVILWGRLPVIYTYPSWWKTLAVGASVEWARPFPLWMANYTHSGPGTPDRGGPTLLAPWDDWAIWQYSAEGSTERIPGIPACPVDRDCIKDKATLLRLTGRSLAEPDDEVTQPFATIHPLVPLESPDLDDEPPPQAA